jgi:hypothetical protein
MTRSSSSAIRAASGRPCHPRYLGPSVSGTATRVPLITKGNPLKTRKNANNGSTHKPKHVRDTITVLAAPRDPPGRRSGMPPRASSASLEG